VASSTYMAARKIFARPQGMLWSDNPGVYQNNMWIPQGVEKEDFVILSDHGRGEISISKDRIENRQRMINGTMRSYFNADKNNVSTSWERLPSRSWNKQIFFDPATGQPRYLDVSQESDPTLPVAYRDLNTVDGGAGGVDLLAWHESHPGPFWVYFAYDKYNNFMGYPSSDSHSHLGIYNEVKLMYFSSFEYTIEKRGGTNFDMWNINVQLEEA
jgi:hypothetical protein